MQTTRLVLTIGLLMMLPATAGCGLAFPGACTLEAVYGVNVSLTDTAGEPITDAVLVLTDGNYQETMEELRPGDYAGAVERAGEYSLSIDADGFDPVMLEGLTVSAGRCHVVPVSRNVVLTSISGITGVMLAGPQCPVVGPDAGDECDDRPIAGTVVVEADDDGHEVTRFTSDDEGVFHVPLAPGAYRLVPLPGPNGLPVADEQSVDVPAGEFVEIEIHFDTGIR